MNRHKQWPFRPLARALSRASHSSPSTLAPPPTASFPLKHVTKSNFEAALEDLRWLVRAADFVAIDLEMTGVTSAPWRESFEFDRFDVRYLKVKDSAEKFAVVQLGLCPFRWDPLKQSFIAHPHNFFVFPRQELEHDSSAHEFRCQTTSMDFLAKYGFDFNACIREGISYLSRRQEEEAVRRLELIYEDEQLESWRKLKEARDVKSVRVADVFFTQRMKDTMSGWRDELLRGKRAESQIKGTSDETKQGFETIFFNMRPALCLKGFTSHQLRLIRSLTEKNFMDLSYIRVAGENSRLQELVVYTDSEQDKESLMREVKERWKRQEETDIRSAIGLRHVIDLLSTEQKLTVGHNCFLDMAHIYNKFLGPLPLTAEEFVASVNQHFPYIIDTKILLNVNNALQRQMKKSRTSLSSAFVVLCPQIALGSETSTSVFQQRIKIDVQVDNVRSSNWSAGAKHEAGYDAFMTGCIFAQACNHLGIDFTVDSPLENLAQNDKLQNYINRLYLSWTNGDIVDLRTGARTAEYQISSNLSRRSSMIKFENILLIWGFPSKLKAGEIRQCISKAFGPTAVTSVYLMDETAAFVQFSKTELVSDFLALKDELDSSKDPLSVLHPLSRLLEGGQTCAARYETYKEICGSPISKVLFADQAEAVNSRWRKQMTVSKSEREQEQRGAPQERSSLDNASDGGSEPTVGEMGSASSDSSYNRLSSDDTVDSFCASTEWKQVRVTNS